MGIKSELHEAILKRGGKVPPYGGIAAAMDELNKLPGGGGVSSWNDIPDRPFGMEIGYVLPECQLMGEDQNGDGVADGFVLTQEMKLTIGKTYIVNYNGTEYNCVAQDASAMAEGLPAVCLGNMAGVGFGDTGEPFVVVYSPEMMAIMAGEGVTGLVMVMDGATSVTLSIKGEIVKPLDAKYLPSEAVRRVYVNFTSADGNVSSGDIANADKTYAEVVACYSNGYDIIGILNAVDDSGEEISFIMPLTAVNKTSGVFSFGVIFPYSSYRVEGVKVDMASDGSMITKMAHTGVND